MRRTFAQHLAGRAGCRGRVEGIQEVDRLLTAACPEPERLSPESSDRIFRQALARSGAARRQHGWWPLAAAASVAVTCAAAWALVPWPETPVAGSPGPTFALAPPPQQVRPVGGKPGLAARASRPQHDAHRHRTGKPAARRAPKERQAIRMTGRFRRPQSIASRFPPRTALRPASIPAERTHGLPEAASPRPAPVRTGPDMGDSYLLVVVTRAEPELEVTVRHASPETPGYARAAAFLPDGVQGGMWTEVTVSSDRPSPEFVLTASPDGSPLSLACAPEPASPDPVNDETSPPAGDARCE